MPRRDFIPMALPVVGDREVELLEEAVRTGWISSQGPFVQSFEAEFARYCGVEHGVAVSSGTAALHVALLVLQVGPGDEVILPPLTHVAMANAVRLTGARPVLVDCEGRHWNLDPGRLEERITPRTRAIFVVHLFGHPADMDPIREIAARHGVPVVEDAAQAHGAWYRDRRAGSLGDMACFSFYSNKILATGEGGMVLTNDARMAERARKVRDQAYERDRRFWHKEFGWNYRLTNLQAAVGLAQLERVQEFVETRRRNAQVYNAGLAGLEGVTRPAEAAWARSVYWMYSLLLDPERTTPEELQARLRRRGIDSRPFFHPIHLQPLYQELFEGEAYPVAQRLAERGLSLPSGNELTEEEARLVAEAVREELQPLG